MVRQLIFVGLGVRSEGYYTADLGSRFRIKLGCSSLIFVLGKLDPNLDLNLSKKRPYTYIRTRGVGVATRPGGAIGVIPDGD